MYVVMVFVQIERRDVRTVKTYEVERNEESGSVERHERVRNQSTVCRWGI